MAKTLAVIGVCMTFAAAFSMPAMAQHDADSRLDRLEREIQTLSRAVFRGEQPSPDNIPGRGGAIGDDTRMQADMELRISRLEREILELTGAIEQQNFKIRQMQEALDRTVSDLGVRVSELEMQSPAGAPVSSVIKPAEGKGLDLGLQTEGGALFPQPSSGQMTYSEQVQGEAENPSLTASSGKLGTLVQKPDGESVTAYSGAETPDALYEKAFAALRGKDYETAEKGFHDFLGRYPGHKLASNANYWLGETYYVRNDYERAARIFAESYQQYPEGGKGPDSLLKLALSLGGMGSTKEACLALDQLERQYSAGPKPILVRAGQEKARFSCP